MLGQWPSRLMAPAIMGALVAAPSSAMPVPLRTKSEIPGVSLIARDVLPRSPENGSVEDYCQGYRSKKLTANGRQVAKLGWIVTSEAPLGPYQVVTFASDFTPGTSALCFARNANIAVFKGSQLVALAYSSRSATSPLGVAEPLESGALLVWTDPPGTPRGELHADSNGVRLTAIALERTFCNRRAVVPNVYGQPLDVARKTLIAHGWEPMRPQKAPNEWNLASDLAKQGIVEAETCSGTGLGYCSLNYRGPAGVLAVTSAGDDPTVAWYTVKCRAR